MCKAYPDENYQKDLKYVKWAWNSPEGQEMIVPTGSKCID